MSHKSTKSSRHKEDEVEVFRADNYCFRIAIDLQSYRRADQSTHYDEQVAKQIAKWGLGFESEWSLNCLTPWTRIQLLDSLRHLNRLAITIYSTKKLQWGWFSSLWRKKQPQHLQQAPVWNTDHRIVASKKECSISHQGCKSPLGDLWNGWYISRRHRSCRIHGIDKHVAIKIHLCPIDEDLELPKIACWIRSKANDCGRRTVLDKANHALVWEQ